MKYNTIKWMILLIPPITIGMWEYVRHAYLIPYLSMEAGNLLAPFIVLAVTILPLLLLMKHMKRIEQELHEEKALKSILAERDNIARELHDGIAQSLFLLSVKLNKFKKSVPENQTSQLNAITNGLESVYKEVRQSIANLSQPSLAKSIHLSSVLNEFIQLADEHQVHLQLQWEIPEEKMSEAEKLTLYACMKESIINALKHSKCTEITISGTLKKRGMEICISDNGCGFPIRKIIEETARDS
jgi:two-component system nitrate/nitrite sensor histidine kinase NarQ